MNKSWAEIDAESEALFIEQMEDAKKRSAAERDFFDAALSAKLSAKNDGLYPAETSLVARNTRCSKDSRPRAMRGKTFPWLCKYSLQS